MGSDRIYLPFLQIYLHKLYIEDFKRTYIDKNKLIPEKHQEFPPLEFEEFEIKKFGNIDKILEEYITDINNELSDNLKEKNAHRIIRFLRNFATIENTKKRIYIKYSKSKGGSSTSIQIANPKINEEIQKNTWGENKSAYDDKINAFIQKLEKYRLLKIKEDYVELSHDILAKLINRFPFEKSIREIYRDEFEGIFNAHYKGDGSYLNISQVRRFKEKKYLDFILTDQDEEIKRQKKLFWTVSEHRTQLLIKSVGFLVFLSMLGLISITTFLLNQRKNLKKTIEKLEMTQDSLKSSNLKSKSYGQVYQKTGEAFNNLKSDPTNAFKGINATDSIKYFHDNPKPKLIGDFKNDLYDGFHKYPFYSKNIQLPDKNGIAQIKHIISKTDPDSLYIYALNKKDDLFEIRINLSNNVPPSIDTIGKEVKLFEPFYEDGLITLLYVHNNEAYKKRENQKEATLLSIPWQIPLTKSNILTHIKEDIFLANSWTYLYEFQLLDTTLNRVSIDSFIKTHYTPMNIKRVDKSDNKNGNYYISGTQGKTTKFYKSSLSRDYGDFIGSVKHLIDFNIIQNNKLIYASGDTLTEIQYYNYRNSKNQKESHSIKGVHEDEITSIACLKNTDYLLLGSSDRTASLWKDFKLVKRLVGHTDAISDVSFINKRYGITASEDGSIKIWDLNPIEKKTLAIREARSIEKLKYSPLDSTLLVGFKTKFREDRGYLLAVCDNLKKDESCKKRKFQYRATSDWDKGNITSFDLKPNGDLLLGGFSNHLISSEIDYDTIRYANNFSTINDLVIDKTNLAVATEKGLLFFGNYPSKRKALTNKKENYDTLLQQIPFNSLTIFDKLVVGAAANDKIYLWDLDQQRVDTLNGHYDEVTSVDFSSTGKYFISGSKDNKAIIWQKSNNGNSYQYFQILEDHTSDILDVEFYGDTLLVTASRDNTAQIYKFDKSKKEEGPFIKQPSLIRHDGAINEATFSSDGLYIYTGDNKGIIKKWAFRDFEKDVKARLHLD